MSKIKMAVTLLLAGTLLQCVSAQEARRMDPNPYQYITETWMEPFAEEGFTWGGNVGVHVESENRIYLLQRGETRLPDPLPADYTNFAGSMGWNILSGRNRVWQNCIYVIDSNGNVLEVWDQWDHLFYDSRGPGPHRIRQSPYDPEKRVWVIDESGHIIYVFSNDGQTLLMTLGEKNIAGNDELHYNQPQDVAFLPDGKVLIADGLGNKRIVVRNADGSYHSEFGEEGNAPHQFGSVHGLALGPDGRLFAVDRFSRDVKIFRQTAPRDSSAYPVFEYVSTFSDDNFTPPLDVVVSENYAWVAANPPSVTQFDLDGNRVYAWQQPLEGPDYWIEMHSFATDDYGNIYGTDNQTGRPQKLIPRRDANPEYIVGPQYVPQ